MKDQDDTNNIDIAKRFNSAIALLKGREIIKNQKDISDRGLIAKSNLSRAIKGDPRYLTKSFLEKFAKEFSFNYDWFITGEGEMPYALDIHHKKPKEYSQLDENLSLVMERLHLYEEKIDFYKEKIEKLEEENQQLKKDKKSVVPGERFSTSK
ncbi:hypothetical protein FNJ88_10940 [Chryseobacterium sp. SNU WT5]|uniref:hypothetical protein n=1 Tax=Chryseobacterium sp. SNU WT5 TaxID=2594269 RepID=UPI0011809245|nr:hypothetical protein [Chryseobacterium sp. SNU WT5]QDP86034.1 hypothetical protein FNJ88_10940 [Chryseobacterium sp. SNU WT5]